MEPEEADNLITNTLIRLNITKPISARMREQIIEE